MHPDGHYELNLSNKIDRETARRCIIISNWMRHRSIAMNMVDCSECGNYDCLRHVYFKTEPVQFASEEWQLPEEGLLEFDFVFPRERHSDECPVDDATLSSIWRVIKESPCRFLDQIRALRLVAHSILLSPHQLLWLLELFPVWQPEFSLTHVHSQIHPRVESYIILYNRTLYHSQVVSPMVLFNPRVFGVGEVKEIRSRLGWIHTFDLVNCHSPNSNLGNRIGKLAMHTHDGWLIVKVLLLINQAEKGQKFDNTYYSMKQAMWDRGYTFLIPMDWVPDPPREGILETTFLSKPHDILHARRREIARDFLGWTFQD